MENTLVITQDNKPSMVAGVYLTGMNLKEYMGRCMDGSLQFPKCVGAPVVVNPDLPLLVIENPCGERVVYRTLEDMPEDSVPCSCGDPTHWFIFVEKKEESNGKV